MTTQYLGFTRLASGKRKMALGRIEGIDDERLRETHRAAKVQWARVTAELQREVDSQDEGNEE